ncbi:Photosystem II D1 precursor proCES [Forsythia ovata]|uniref:Photosystem II D1 proCES n=1 Tax=Forsythia ovata TaxID=205694 RepID=A0ABD1PJ50_9LAMI
MASFLATKMCPLSICNSVGHIRNSDRLQFRCHAMFLSEEASSRRQFVLGCGAISSCGFLNLNCELVELPAWAGEESNASDDKNDGVLGTMKSLFDPNEKTKSGKVLPKAYLKSAREMVKTLRESLKEDSKDIAKFRRTADVAKESIREYLNGWRGQKTVVNEESYAVLEKAIRSLASFYSKAGPSAPLPEEIKYEILSDLNKAEELL